VTLQYTLKKKIILEIGKRLLSDATPKKQEFLKVMHRSSCSWCNKSVGCICNSEIKNQYAWLNRGLTITLDKSDWLHILGCCRKLASAHILEKLIKALEIENEK